MKRKADQDSIYSDKLDHNFKYEVTEKIGLEKITPCFTCGACTGACPVHDIVEDFDPRLIINMILLGMREQVLSSDLIWYCCLCNSCYFVCPQSVKFSRIITELRKIALAEGYVDEQFLERLKPVNNYLQDLCRRTMFIKVREGFHGLHTMPCWRKYTIDDEVSRG